MVVFISTLHGNGYLFYLVFLLLKTALFNTVQMQSGVV